MDIGAGRVLPHADTEPMGLPGRHSWRPGLEHSAGAAWAAWLRLWCPARRIGAHRALVGRPCGPSEYPTVTLPAVRPAR